MQRFKNYREVRLHCNLRQAGVTSCSSITCAPGQFQKPTLWNPTQCSMLTHVFFHKCKTFLRKMSRQAALWNMFLRSQLSSLKWWFKLLDVTLFDVTLQGGCSLRRQEQRKRRGIRLRCWYSSTSNAAPMQMSLVNCWSQSLIVYPGAIVKKLAPRENFLNTYW